MSDAETPLGPEPDRPAERGVAYGPIHTIWPNGQTLGGEPAAESKPLRFHSVLQSPAPQPKPTSPYSVIADDVEWLRAEWTGDEPPSAGQIRRGSATLRHLLVDNLLGEAWRAHGFMRSPVIIGPDLVGLITGSGTEVRHVVAAIAGGARKNGAFWAGSAAFRVRNEKTGMGPDADEGFAVGLACVVLPAEPKPAAYNTQPSVEKSWSLPSYLNAAGAIRRGKEISRRTIIQYAANYAGGVHLDRAQGRFPKKHAEFELAAELENASHVDGLNGLYFELLSIGQATATSPDILRLVEAIRAAER